MSRSSVKTVMPEDLWTAEDIGTGFVPVTGYSPDQREPGDSGIEQRNLLQPQPQPVARRMEHREEGPQKESSELQAGGSWRNTQNNGTPEGKREQIIHDLGECVWWAPSNPSTSKSLALQAYRLTGAGPETGCSVTLTVASLLSAAWRAKIWGVL